MLSVNPGRMFYKPRNAIIDIMTRMKIEARSAPKTKFWYLEQLMRTPAIWFACAAAILYCSWPLGFVLNPNVGRHDLASQLEALHQPFNWVFISMDVLTGVALIIAGVRQARKKTGRQLFKWAVWGYVAFGFFTALAALMPLNCDPETHSCGPLLHNPILVVHGFSSIASVMLLLVSTLLLCATVYRRPGRNTTRWAFGLILMAWAIYGYTYFVGVSQHTSSNLMQYYFITICSLSVLLVIGTIEYLQLLESQHLQTEALPEV